MPENKVPQTRQRLSRGVQIALMTFEVAHRLIMDFHHVRGLVERSEGPGAVGKFPIPRRIEGGCRQKGNTHQAGCVQVHLV